MRIIARLNVGGPAQHVIHLTDALRESFPTLLVTGDPEPNEAQLYVEKDVPVYRIPELGRRVRPLQDLIAFIALVRLLRHVRPRIVHTHTAKAGTLGRLAAWVARVPVRVHTYHGHVFHGYFGRLGSALVRAVERLLSVITTRVIAISETQAQEISGRFGICSRTKIDVIQLGLELDRFSTPDADAVNGLRVQVAPGGEFVVAIVGRLEPIKNHDMVLEAAALLRKQAVVFLVVGGGSEEERLRARARDLGIAQRLRFLGWRSDLPEIYAASDLVVLTSRNEGTPVCLIEALAAGKRVIATDIGGVRDVLANGEYGTLIPSGRSEVLAREIARTILEAPQPERQRAAMMHARSLYSVERLASDMGNLYGRLTAGTRIPARTPLPQTSYQA